VSSRRRSYTQPARHLTARFAEAFTAANRDRLLTDALRKRDERRNSIAAVGGLGLLVVVWWLFGRKRK
jgi:LPXTG-motif cell wall-anchored protein